MVSRAAPALLLCSLSALAFSPALAQSDPERFITEPERVKEAEVGRSPEPAGVEVLRPQPGRVPVQPIQPIPTAPAAPEGWCCLRGQSFASPAPACQERGGQFFDLRHDAERQCQAQRPAQPRPEQPPAPPPPPPRVPPAPPPPPPPRAPAPEGWCCLHGDVVPAPEPSCREAGGLFFPDPEHARHECRAMQRPEQPAPPQEPPPEEAFGACCLHGELIHAPEHECREAGGAFFHDPGIARRECRPGAEPSREEPPPPHGWCCREGDVFPAPEFECRELRGAFFPEPEAAERECRFARPPAPPPPEPQPHPPELDPPELNSTRPQTVPPERLERVCPQGCQCLTAGQAQQLGLHAKCEEPPCGHAANVDQDKFCFGKTPGKPCQGDIDCDGVPDAKDNCPKAANPGQQDSEKAWIKTPQGWIPGAALGKNTKNGDGVGDVCDNCPKVMNANQWDSDNDGVGNDCDNCSSQANADQKDADGDEVGDVCDGCPGGDDTKDADSDGVGDACDNCPKVASADQKDSDGDTEGDACDRCPLVHNALDTDKDGVADCDDQCPGQNDKIDADKDSIADCADNCPGVHNAAQTYNSTTQQYEQNDFDGDGLGDACDCDDGKQGPNETGCDCGGACPMLCSYCQEKTLPARFDYRDWKCKSWMTSVKNQAQCGSCWAFSAVGAAEAQGVIQQKPKGGINLSEQFLVSSTGYGDDCKGGRHDWALEQIRDKGLTLEGCFPYQSQSCLDKDDNCVSDCKWSSGVWSKCSKPKAYQGLQITAPCANVLVSGGYKISGFSEVDSSTSKFKRALVCKGPLSVCSSDWGHCIVVVGWDDSFAKSGYKGAWIIKNSWGSNWTAQPSMKKGSSSLWTAGPGFAHIPYSGHPYSDIIDRGLAIDGIDGSSAYAK